MTPTPTTIRIGGRLDRGVFKLRLTNSLAVLPMVNVCDLGPAGKQELQTPLPFQPLTDFPMEVAAASAGLAESPPGIRLFVTARR